MKLAPVSSDLLIKIALGAAGMAAAYYVYRKVTGAAGAALSSAGHTIAAVADQAVTAVNPADPGNLVNQGVLAAGQAVTGDSSWSLGGWVYDITHPSQTPGNAPTPLILQNQMKPGQDTSWN